MRFLAGAAMLTGATLLVAVGCGGGSSGGSSNGGSGGSSDTGGDTSTGGDASPQGGSSAGGTGHKGGTGGATDTGGSTATGGDAGALGEGGEAGAAPPAQNHSAVSFVGGGEVSTSANFKLIGAVGESLGGTVGSKRSKSLKYTYIPGVIAGSTN